MLTALILELPDAFKVLVSWGIPAVRVTPFSELPLCEEPIRRLIPEINEEEEEEGVEVDVEGEVTAVDLFGKLSP